jgi:hypothetical protein
MGRTAGVEGQIVYNPMGSLNGGVQKSSCATGYDQIQRQRHIYTQQFSAIRV